MCQQLGAPVQGSWKACSLALPPFAPSWETLEDAWSLPDATPVVVPGGNLPSELEPTNIIPVEVTAICNAEQARTETVLI
ncbi:hypothetical protein FDUTEX481_02479 [Tolypothrix sp. PCC 7601]|nr:hypothetical protein FDUTEX481_02479 [Tolypothrix sp. PCC 7601]